MSELIQCCVQAQRAVVHLKDQVNKLEAELEDQRTHKQVALVENEQLRMEVEALRTQTAVAASLQASVDDSESSFVYTRHSFSISWKIVCKTIPGHFWLNLLLIGVIFILTLLQILILLSKCSECLNK